jgi:pyruvate dehydrogenase E1 component
MDELTHLRQLERKVLWLSAWMVHHANHIRSHDDGIKVGGHQASSASLATIMTALYFNCLRTQDRVAVKPHASPAYHAIRYLLGSQTRDKLENFRGYKGAQSYPSRTKDTTGVDFSTGSVGLGVAQTLFASLAQDYIHAKDWAPAHPEGRMIALLGDAEMDEGNVYEALIEGQKHGLRNTWWIIDYNRQSLDAVIQEGLCERLQAVFACFGWRVELLKYGSLLQEAFLEPGGDQLRQWIDDCPNQLYSALTFQGGEAWRSRLLQDLAGSNSAIDIVNRRSDAELASLMTNLAGHDLPTLIETFQRYQNSDTPVCFIAYTIKGFGLPLAGHKDNHAGLMTPAQISALRSSMNIREGHEWDLFEGLSSPLEEMERFLHAAAARLKADFSYKAGTIEIPERLKAPQTRVQSTQAAFGSILNEIGREDTEFARRVVTTSPDVSVSTNLGPWINKRGLFARREEDDVFRKERIASAFVWQGSQAGQHVELGIAEMNLMTMLSAFGLSHSLFGQRLFPIGTLYDPFVQRCLDALNYACYQDARFMLAATPSGITLAPEGGAHQSISTPLIGLAQDGLASFEPSFVDELALIMRFGFTYMQSMEDTGRDPKTCLCDGVGGSIYLRLSTRPLEQPVRQLSVADEANIVSGGYWLKHPGPNAEVVIAYTGAVAPEAIQAAGLLGEDRRVGLLAITSADRLYAGWTAAGRERETGHHDVRCHIERLLGAIPPHCGLVTVLDGHPATLGWLGSVYGHQTRSLGVEHFGQTGTIDELYCHYGLDAHAILRAAQAISPGRPIRHGWIAA